MFTQSHYTAIAKILRETNPDYDTLRNIDYWGNKNMWGKITDNLIKLFEDDNENFNKQKFNKALEV